MTTEAKRQPSRGTVPQADADRMADAITVLILRGKLDARSPAGDALLDYRDPPSTERTDRIVSLEMECEALRARMLRMQRAGQGCANACFNLSQDSRLADYERKSLRAGADEWDAATK